MAEESNNNGLWGSLLVSLASSAANSASNSVNNEEQWEYQQKQNKWNAEQAEVAYNRQLAFWDKQNEYNSPVQQIARLRAAGINPNLAYANGSLNNVNQNTPSVNSAESQLTGNYKGLDFSTIPTSFVDTYIKNAQLKQIQAQTDKIQKENEYQGITNQIKMATWYDEIRALQHKYRSNKNLEDLADEALEQARIQSSQMRNDLAFSQGSLTGRLNAVELQNQSISISNEMKRCDLKIQQAKVPYANKMAALEYKHKTQEILNMYLQGIYTKEQANLAYQQSLTESSVRGLNNAKIDTEGALNGYYKQQKALGVEQTTSTGLGNLNTLTKYSFDYPDSPLGHLINKDGKWNAAMVDNYVQSLLNGAGTAVVGYYLGKTGAGKTPKVKGFGR